MDGATDRRDPWLAAWLALVCLLLGLMILLGGATRLTGSGLSMVDWRPLAGAIPPMTDAAWQEAFAAYRESPEYRLVNRGMPLDAFKTIFYWEYGHRLAGRVIGLVFFVPFAAFLALGRIRGALAWRLALALALGGLQGLLGWYLVQSGLVDVPRVSHYRLGAHLLLAFFILAYLFWLLLSVRQAARAPAPPWLAAGAWSFAALLALQLLAGAFTAGLKAGQGFNTYPLMHGHFLAPAASMMEPWSLNLVENGVMVQFIHRWLGAGLLLLALALLLGAWRGRSALLGPVGWLAGLTLAQFLLGIATLVYRAPLLLGSLHQGLGVLLALATTYLLYAQSGAGKEGAKP